VFVALNDISSKDMLELNSIKMGKEKHSKQLSLYVQLGENPESNYGPGDL
jgi:hypothetical protein